MRITVNSDLCSGHGRCYDVGDPVFHADDEGFCVERGSTFTVPAGSEDRARAGAASCPEGALTIDPETS